MIQSVCFTGEHGATSPEHEATPPYMDSQRLHTDPLWYSALELTAHCTMLALASLDTTLSTTLIGATRSRPGGGLRAAGCALPTRPGPASRLRARAESYLRH